MLAVVAMVAGFAFTRLGAPVRSTRTARGVFAFAVVGGAMLLKLSTDLLPPTWPGAVSLVVILALSGVLLVLALVALVLVLRKVPESCTTNPYARPEA